MHGQRTDSDRRGEWPGTRESSLSQPGLRRDTRLGPTFTSTHLDYDVRSIGQPEAAHHRRLVQLKQHVRGFATQMVATPCWQPVRQIVQRHDRYCLLIDFNVQRFLAAWTASSRIEFQPGEKLNGAFGPKATATVGGGALLGEFEQMAQPAASSRWSSPRTARVG
jgi:hypothetical protein